MKKIKYCLLALLCPIVMAAQTIKPLKIGDQIPDIELQRVLNNTEGIEKISDLKSRLLIIDFWATYCTACLQGFEKIAQFKKHFGNSFSVLMVNSANSGDDEKKIKSMLQKRVLSDGNPISFPILVKDTIFKKLFPFKLLPHYVWVVDGRIAAITGTKELTLENAVALLNGNTHKLAIKQDQDRTKPLFTNDALPNNQLLFYSVLTKGQFSGFGSGNRYRRKGNLVHGRAMTNSTLLQLYYAVGQQLIPGFSHKRIIINTSDSARLYPPYDIEVVDDWYEVHLYNYDIIVPPERAYRLYTDMLEDLNRYSGFRAIIANQTHNVWVLRTDNNFNYTGNANGIKINRMKDNTQPCLENGSMDDLLRYLEKLDFLFQPIIDETGYKGLLSICLEPGKQNLHTLQLSLSHCGLQLQLVQRTLPMMTISNK